MNRRIVAAVIMLVVTAALFARAASILLRPDEPGHASITQEIMATPVTVIAPAPVAGDIAAIVFDAFHEIDRTMSEWKPESPLTAVNRAAGRHPVEAPDDLRAVIRRGIEIGDLTGGAFDLTWAALWGLWDFKAETPALPDPEEIRRRVALIDYREIIVDDEEGTVFLPREGMLIGLGGIAKGTALNRAAVRAQAAGYDSFLISAGGQVIVRGRRGERPWRVGIRDPRGAPDDCFAELELNETSISTSGDYERFFILDGTRYHHILDPRTGRPARGLRSATVVCPDAERGDALSTAFMILGLDQARALADRLADVEAVFVDDTGRVHVTPGLADEIVIRHPPADREE